MIALPNVAAWLAGASSLSPWTKDSQQPLLVESNDAATLWSTLGSRLSDGASVKLPDASGWDELVSYAASPRLQPGFDAVVEVATESDIQTTIEFANQHNFPFLAVTGYHAVTNSLRKMDGGIQIHMRKMNSVDLDESEGIVTFGGGVLQPEAVDFLADHGKQTVTGFGGCVSVIGPLLGGGHGILQGRYGLAADNLVSARLVLANGTAVDVSDSSHSDLFWAIRGAGHNFGVVSSYQMKAYDVPEDDQWTFLDFIYTWDRLEEVLEVVNSFTEEENHPAELVILGAIVRAPPIDPHSPVIAYSVIFQGAEEDAEPFAAPFRALGPIVGNIRTDIPYEGLTPAAGFDQDSLFCQKNNNLESFPTSVSRFNISAMREAADIFADLTEDEALQQSAFILESYGMIGARDFDGNSTAVAQEQRDRDIFTFPLFLWQGEHDDIRKKAESGAIAITDVIKNGAEEMPYSYLNHAHGHESLEEMYGNEEWRLEKLKVLKKTWDPENRFGFYNPLA